MPAIKCVYFYNQNVCLITFGQKKREPLRESCVKCKWTSQILKTVGLFCLPVCAHSLYNFLGIFFFYKSPIYTTSTKLNLAFTNMDAEFIYPCFSFFLFNSNTERHYSIYKQFQYNIWQLKCDKILLHTTTKNICSTPTYMKQRKKGSAYEIKENFWRNLIVFPGF